MSKQNIKPEKITKPMQLLGAWLAGLFSIDSCFLFAAANMKQGTFESYSLTIAAILNVPLFLIAVFLLQTKFRPELQEDSYYSTYLNQKTNKKVTISKTDLHVSEITKEFSVIKQKIKSLETNEITEGSNLYKLNIGINLDLPNIDAVKSALKAKGVSSYSTFGSGEAPDNMVIAIAPLIGEKSTQEILELAKEIGFSHYSYLSLGDENIMEEVLIGAYGDADREIL